MDNRPRIDLDDPTAYGAAFADVYDQWYRETTASPVELSAMAEFVSRRCPSKTVVELGVGSGRLATPLIERGLRVVGVDASIQMLVQCSAEVDRVAADIGALPLAYGAAPTLLCGFNTLFNLHSVERLRNLLVAVVSMKANLIVEVMNAELLAEAPTRSTGRSSSSTENSRTTGVVISSTAIDHTAQTLAGRHLHIDDKQVVSRPWLLRWITLAELDAEAGAVGLHLTERYRDWTEKTFTDTSTVAVSVYRPDSST